MDNDNFNKIVDQLDEKLKKDSKLRKISSKLEKQTQEKFDKDKYDSESRYKITIKFIRYYFGFLILVFILVAVYNSYAVLWKVDALNLKDMISLFVASFGSTLGFIIGYYFKAGDKG